MTKNDSFCSWAEFSCPVVRVSPDPIIHSIIQCSVSSKVAWRVSLNAGFELASSMSFVLEK